VTTSPRTLSGRSSSDRASNGDVRLALRREEAAEALGVSTDTFDHVIRPELAAVHIGRRRVWRVAELERWLVENEKRVLED
jgi:predicted DNA-binding transcriptional regulator AlpA